MTVFHLELIKRFGSDSIQEINSSEGKVPLLLIDLKKQNNVSVLVTNGLSEYTMPVPELYQGKEHIELYFCLPNYWDLNEENMKWVYTWLHKMSNYLIDKKTWFGYGHTIPSGADKGPISTTMKQNHFLLAPPQFLTQELIPIDLEDKNIHFLSIIPIFQDELNFKNHKGTYKLLELFKQKNITEKLDDFRLSAKKKKWLLFKS